MKLLLLALALAAFGSSAAEKVRFDNYKVFRLTPSDEQGLKALKELEERELSGYDFWSPVAAVGVPVDLMAPPHLVGQLVEVATGNGIHSSVLMENLQERIDAESAGSESRDGRFGWTRYQSLDEINAWLTDLPKKYPGVVTLIEGGTSYENRTILGVKVSYSILNTFNGVFLESNIHAREWITSAVSTYLLNEILTSKDADVRRIAQSHDWYFFPVFNPDGFEFSRTHNRMWRKTRVPHSLLCVGTDPNRNWAYNWNMGGASSQPCSDTYMGPSPFSEPSTASMALYIDGIHNKLVAYLSLHSYSQLLLLPYGHVADHLDNYNVMYPIGLKAAEALAKRYGTQYRVGNTYEAIYQASGGSVDWVKGNFKTPIAYTYELRDKGRNGFLLPPEQIIPTGEETMDSLITILDEYKKVKN